MANNQANRFQHQHHHVSIHNALIESRDKLAQQQQKQHQQQQQQQTPARSRIQRRPRNSSHPHSLATPPKNINSERLPQQSQRKQTNAKKSKPRKTRSKKKQSLPPKGSLPSRSIHIPDNEESVVSGLPSLMDHSEETDDASNSVASPFQRGNVQRSVDNSLAKRLQTLQNKKIGRSSRIVSPSMPSLVDSGDSSTDSLPLDDNDDDDDDDDGEDIDMDFERLQQKEDDNDLYPSPTKSKDFSLASGGIAPSPSNASVSTEYVYEQWLHQRLGNTSDLERGQSTMSDEEGDTLDFELQQTRLSVGDGNEKEGVDGSAAVMERGNGMKETKSARSWKRGVTAEEKDNVDVPRVKRVAASPFYSLPSQSLSQPKLPVSANAPCVGRNSNSAIVSSNAVSNSWKQNRNQKPAAWKKPAPSSNIPFQPKQPRQEEQLLVENVEVILTGSEESTSSEESESDFDSGKEGSNAVSTVQERLKMFESSRKFSKNMPSLDSQRVANSGRAVFSVQPKSNVVAAAKTKEVPVQQSRELPETMNKSKPPPIATSLSKPYELKASTHHSFPKTIPSKRTPSTIEKSPSPLPHRSPNKSSVHASPKLGVIARLRQLDSRGLKSNAVSSTQQIKYTTPSKMSLTERSNAAEEKKEDASIIPPKNVTGRKVEKIVVDRGLHGKNEEPARQTKADVPVGSNWHPLSKQIGQQNQSEEQQSQQRERKFSPQQDVKKELDGPTFESPSYDAHKKYPDRNLALHSRTSAKNIASSSKAATTSSSKFVKDDETAMTTSTSATTQTWTTSTATNQSITVGTAGRNKVNNQIKKMENQTNKEMQTTSTMAIARTLPLSQEEDENQSRSYPPSLTKQIDKKKVQNKESQPRSSSLAQSRLSLPPPPAKSISFGRKDWRQEVRLRKVKSVASSVAKFGHKGEIGAINEKESEMHESPRQTNLSIIGEKNAKYVSEQSASSTSEEKASVSLGQQQKKNTVTAKEEARSQSNSLSENEWPSPFEIGALHESQQKETSSAVNKALRSQAHSSFKTEWTSSGPNEGTKSINNSMILNKRPAPTRSLTKNKWSSPPRIGALSEQQQRTTSKADDKSALHEPPKETLPPIDFDHFIPASPPVSESTWPSPLHSSQNAWSSPSPTASPVPSIDSTSTSERGKDRKDKYGQQFHSRKLRSSFLSDSVGECEVTKTPEKMSASEKGFVSSLKRSAPESAWPSPIPRMSSPISFASGSGGSKDWRQEFRLRQLRSSSPKSFISLGNESVAAKDGIGDALEDGAMASPTHSMSENQCPSPPRTSSSKSSASGIGKCRNWKQDFQVGTSQCSPPLSSAALRGKTKTDKNIPSHEPAREASCTLLQKKCSQQSPIKRTAQAAMHGIGESLPTPDATLSPSVVGEEIYPKEDVLPKLLLPFKESIEPSQSPSQQSQLQRQQSSSSIFNIGPKSAFQDNEHAPKQPLVTQQKTKIQTAPSSSERNRCISPKQLGSNQKETSVLSKKRFKYLQRWRQAAQSTTRHNKNQLGLKDNFKSSTTASSSSLHHAENGVVDLPPCSITAKDEQVNTTQFLSANIHDMTPSTQNFVTQSPYGLRKARVSHNMSPLDHSAEFFDGVRLSAEGTSERANDTDEQTSKDESPLKQMKRRSSLDPMVKTDLSYPHPQQNEISLDTKPSIGTRALSSARLNLKHLVRRPGKSYESSCCDVAEGMHSVVVIDNSGNEETDDNCIHKDDHALDNNAQSNATNDGEADDSCPYHETPITKPLDAQMRYDEGKDKEGNICFIREKSVLAKSKVCTQSLPPNIDHDVTVDTSSTSAYQLSFSSSGEKICSSHCVSGDNIEESSEKKQDQPCSSSETTHGDIEIILPLSAFIVASNEAQFQPSVFKEEGHQSNVSGDHVAPTLCRQATLYASSKSKEVNYHIEENEDAKRVRWVPSLVRLFQYKLTREKTDGWKPVEKVSARENRGIDGGEWKPKSTLVHSFADEFSVDQFHQLDSFFTSLPTSPQQTSGASLENSKDNDHETDRRNEFSLFSELFSVGSLDNDISSNVFDCLDSAQNVNSGQNARIQKRISATTNSFFSKTDELHERGENAFTTPDTSHVDQNNDGLEKNSKMKTTSPRGVMDIFHHLERFAREDHSLDLETQSSIESLDKKIDPIECTSGVTGDPSHCISHTSLLNLSQTIMVDCAMIGAEELSLCHESIGKTISSPEKIVEGAMKGSLSAEGQQGTLRHQHQYQDKNWCSNAEQEVKRSYEYALKCIVSGKLSRARDVLEGFLNQCNKGKIMFENDKIKNQVIGNTMHSIATVMMRGGNFNINDLWKDTVQTRKDHTEKGLYHPHVADSLNEMGICLFACKKYCEALEVFTNVLQIRKEINEVEHEWIAKIFNNIGVTHFAMQKHHIALGAFDKALEVCRQVLVCCSGSCLSDLMNKGAKKSPLRNVLPLNTRNYATLIKGSNNTDARSILDAVSNTLYNIAHVNTHLCQIEDALVAIKEGVLIQQMIFGGENQQTKRSLKCLSYLKSLQNSPEFEKKVASTEEAKKLTVYNT